MAAVVGYGYTAEQRVQLWERWKQGQSLSDIARALRKRPASVRQVLLRQGGIVAAPRHASPRALRLSEREEISRGLAAGLSIRRIAAGLSRAPSSVSREVRRHGGVQCYRACEANQAAADRARRPKACKLAVHRRLQRTVAGKLALDWSPQQICAWLERRYRDDDTMRVSHETIYRSLFIQARGALKKQLAEPPAHRTADAALEEGHQDGWAKSWMRSRSENDLPKLRIGRYRGTGKAICCAGQATLRSQPWWSGTRALRCW